MANTIDPIAEFISEHRDNIRYVADWTTGIIRIPWYTNPRVNCWEPDTNSLLLGDIVGRTEARLGVIIDRRQLRKAIRYDYTLRITGRLAFGRRRPKNMRSSLYEWFLTNELPPPAEGQFLLAAAQRDPGDHTLRLAYLDWVMENPHDMEQRFHIAEVGDWCARHVNGKWSFLGLYGLIWGEGTSKRMLPTEENIRAYAACQAWLTGCKPSASRTFLTSDLCRCVERTFGFPIPAGVFIAAAEADGFRSKPIPFSPYVLHGISTRSHGLKGGPDVPQYRDRDDIERLLVDQNWVSRPGLRMVPRPGLRRVPRNTQTDWLIPPETGNG